MTDRELLEAAAKAAGMHFEDGRQLNPKKYLVCPIGSNPIDCSRGWNPLTDDGDALRLAVKLAGKLPFVIHIQELGCMASDCDMADAFESNENNSDPYAATRRAIVTAAAEIGANS